MNVDKYMPKCICTDQRIILGELIVSFLFVESSSLSLFLLCCAAHSRLGGPWTSRQLSCLCLASFHRSAGSTGVCHHIRLLIRLLLLPNSQLCGSKLGTRKYGVRVPKVESVRWRLALRSGLESRLICKELVSLFLFPTTLPPASSFLTASKFVWRKRSFESLVVKVPNKRYFVRATVLAIWG